jgi:tetratricopeptide (TPR) repeat protein
MRTIRAVPRLAAALLVLLPLLLPAAPAKSQLGEEEILALIAKDPKNAALYAELGSLRSRKNDLEKAELDFRKAVTLDPRCAEAYAGMAGIGLKQRRFQQAREYAQVAVALQPADAWFLSLLARADIALDRTDEAIASLNKAIALKGKQTDWLYSLLAECYEKRKDYRKSAELILKQLESRPWDDTVYVEAAKKYYQAGLPAEADRYRRMAGNAWKEYERLKALRDERYKAWELFKKGGYAEALEIFLRLRDLDPSKPYYYWAAGLAYQRMGDRGEAAGQFEKAAGLDPAFERAYSGLGSLSEETRDYQAAEAWYRKALGLKPSDVYVTRDLMEVLIKQRKWPEARTAAVELTKLVPDEDYYWSALGYVSTKLADDQAAFNAYFQALLNSRTQKEKKKYLKKAIDSGLRACNADPSLRPEVARRLLRQMPADHPDLPVVTRLAEKQP